MKKSLLALAVLGAFAGAASAQSSVTLYGKLDQAVGKDVGKTDKEVRDGSGSRVGFRGVEDLGGGLKALFQFEHRFTPDTGAANATFWQGLSTVGLGGSFGTVNIGRQYTAAFSLAQNVIDPFVGDSIGNLRGYSLTGSVATVRAGGTAASSAFSGAGSNGGNTVRYDGSFGGLKVAADISEPSTGPDRPYSVAAQYAAGPFMVAASYENPTGADDNLITVGGSYVVGPAKVSLGFGSGDVTATTTVKQALVGVAVNVGAAGQVLAGYAQHKLSTESSASKKVSLGYRHNLSKRTQLYTDFTRVNQPLANKLSKPAEKTGYDFGVIHTF